MIAPESDFGIVCFYIKHFKNDVPTLKSVSEVCEQQLFLQVLVGSVQPTNRMSHGQGHLNLMIEHRGLIFKPKRQSLR